MVTPASLDAFAEALVRAYLLVDRHVWTLAAAGALGGPRTARALGELLLELRSAARRTEVCDRLREISTRSPAGVEELVHAAFAPATAPRVRELANAALLQMFPDGIDAGFADLRPAIGARAVEAQRVWFESLMVEGRALSRAAFDAVIGDPRRLADARTLLWCDRDEHGAIAGMFRLDERGAPTRRDGTRYEPTGRLGLVHPAELTDAALDSALAIFTTAQAILQLARPRFFVTAAEAGSECLGRFEKRRVGFHPIANTLRARGWYVVASEIEDDDGDERWRGTDSFARVFPRDGVEVTARLNETRGSIESVHLTRDAGVSSTFGDLHVVTLSELLWDLEVAHGWRALPAATPPPAPPGRVPVIERAKTGRAKCVVCALPIVKDALRIGIERMVETPTFRGLATVWLHPACRANLPELAGVDLEGLD